MTTFSQTRYELGPCRLEDASGQADVLGALLASIDPWKALRRPASELSERYRRIDPSAHRFAILQGGELVGTVIVRYPFMRGPYLETLGLLESARGLGIGRAIIDWMEAEVAGEARNLWLCVSDWNEPAREFYRRMGFAEVNAIPDLAIDGATEIFMRKTLFDKKPAAPLNIP